jgi:hypothetical protein
VVEHSVETPTNSCQKRNLPDCPDPGVLGSFIIPLAAIKCLDSGVLVIGGSLDDVMLRISGNGEAVENVVVMSAILGTCTDLDGDAVAVILASFLQICLVALIESLL